MINGIQQYLVHRTENAENPVLLVLHGGPGESAIPTRYLYQREWERYFTGGELGSAAVRQDAAD